MIFTVERRRDRRVKSPGSCPNRGDRDLGTDTGAKFVDRAALGEFQDVEARVFRLIGDGLDDEAIARSVGCSLPCVREYRRLFKARRIYGAGALK